ncbi:MAG: hypothetical protein ACE362_04515 [Phaeodactylibacter xiamenensis]|nr:hypothetical protein [Phaeodactylibacter xiamenensis]
MPDTIIAQSDSLSESVKLLVVDFEGGSGYDPFLLRQMGQMLSYELEQFALPVLSLEERNRRINLLAHYQDDVPDSTKWDESHPRPDYLCRGIVTEEYLTVNIVQFRDEKQIARAIIRNRGRLEHKVSRLAGELVRELLKTRYQNLSLDQLSLMGVRLPKGQQYNWLDPDFKKSSGTNWIEVDRNVHALRIFLETQGGDTVQVGPYPGLQPNTHQLWTVRPNQLEPGSLRPKIHSLSLSSQFFTYQQHASVGLSLDYHLALTGKLSLGAGVKGLRLPVETRVTPLPGFEAEPVLEEELLLLPSASVVYKRYASQSGLFYGAELGVFFLHAGGHASFFAGFGRFPWLRLKAGFNSFNANLPNRSFRLNHQNANLDSIKERVSLFSVGLQWNIYL